MTNFFLSDNNSSFSVMKFFSEVMTKVNDSGKFTVLSRDKNLGGVTKQREEW